MNTPSPELLDASELKHLALKAMKEDKHDDAIRFLKQAIALSPDDAELHYLLGAMHALIGLMERAIKEMTHAVTLAPDFHVARFQVGLLHFSSRDFNQAKAMWAPLLEKLPDDDPLRIFAIGLEQLGNDDLEGCLAMLRRGIPLCRSANLNADMHRVIQEAEAELAKSKTAGAAAATADASQHVLLAGYQPMQKPF